MRFRGWQRMNNEMKNVNQSKKGTLNCVPALRFPKFRDSELWNIKQINKLLTIGSGKDYKHLSSGDIPVYGSGGYMLSVNDYLYDGDSVCIGRKGTIDKPRFLTGKFWTVDTLFYTHSFIKCTPRFIFYQFQKINWLNYSEAGGIPSLSKTTIGKIEISVPSIEEQNKISDCLSSLDEIISLQKQKIDTLHNYKKGLMQKLFTIEGGMVSELRFSEFENDPEWVVTTIGSKATKVGSGITPKGGDKNYKRDGRPFVRSQNIGWGILLLEDIAFIDDETHSKFTSSEIKNGDVLLNITGASIGRCAVADNSIKGGNVNQHVCIIRTKRLELEPSFLNQYLLSSAGQKQIDSFQAGGNRQGLNFSQIRSFSLPLPQLKEQQKISNCLSSLDELVSTEVKKLAALETHKVGLMQQLLPAIVEANA